MMRRAQGRRVLMTADTVGGVWTYAMELTRELCRSGWQVTLATMGGPASADQVAEATAIAGLDWIASDLRLEWMDDPWHDVDEAGRWLLDVEAAVAPAVVHLNGFAHAALPWRSPVLVVGHSCVASWWEAVRGEEAPEGWNEYRRRVRAGLAHADLVVAPTAAMLAALARQHGPLPATRVIGNGRDPSRFAGTGQEPFVLTVGRLWDEAKNTAALAHVAHRLPWPVYLAGEERHPTGGTTPAAGCRSLGRLGQDGIAHWLGRAAIYAHPAKYEPFGLAAVEAALSGCALVLGDIASLREVWGDAASFADPADPEAIHDAVRRLIDDAPLRRELAGRARWRARELSPVSMARAYRESYADLTRRKAAA